MARRRVLGVVFVVMGALAAGVGASCAEDGTTVPPGTPANEGALPASGNAGWSALKADLPAKRATAQAEIAEGVRNLATAGNSCSEACPAMLVYQLGVKHLCSVADTKDDARVCKDNKKALAAAELALKPSCGACGANAGPPDASDDAPDYEKP
jgi:hypothetical protein